MQRHWVSPIKLYYIIQFDLDAYPAVTVAWEKMENDINSRR